MATFVIPCQMTRQSILQVKMHNLLASMHMMHLILLYLASLGNFFPFPLCQTCFDKLWVENLGLTIIKPSHGRCAEEGMAEKWKKARSLSLFAHHRGWDVKLF